MTPSEVLRAAGWSEDRATDTSSEERSIAEHGYPLWAALAAFLRQFSGLTLHFSRHQRDDTIWFEAARASSRADAASVQAYAARVGTQLVPVGYAYHDHLLLMLGENGHMIAAYDDYVADLGSSAIEAIANLISQELQQLPFP